MVWKGIKGLTKKAIGSLEQSIAAITERERKAQIQYILERAARAQPDGTWSSWREINIKRHEFMQGSMQRVMRETIKRRFPQTYEMIEHEQLNFQLYASLISEKAKVFSKEARFELVDESGEVVDNPNWTELVSLSGLHRNLQYADFLAQGMESCMLKVWWDPYWKHVRVDAWPNYLCWIIPSQNPGEEGEVDLSTCVAFERAAEDINNKTLKRYEIWAYREDDEAAEHGMTLHYITDTEGNDYKVNEGDINPYVDPEDGEPVYPFVWLQNQDYGQIYTLTNEDATTVNEMLNSGMTDLNWSMHMAAFGAWARERTITEKNSPPLKEQLVRPGTIIDLPPGSTLKSLNSNIPFLDIFELWKSLIDVDCKLNGYTHSVLQRDSHQASSGVELSIRKEPAIEDRLRMVEIYKPRVEAFMRRVVIVHNYHCDQALRIPDNLQPTWVPGDMSIPTDPNQEALAAQSRLASKLTSRIEERMRLFDEEREVAEKAVAMIDEESRAAFTMYGGFGVNNQNVPNPNEPEDDDDDDSEDIEE